MTAVQMDISECAKPRTPAPAPNSITSGPVDKFFHFHRQNPHVYQGLEKFALMAKQAGKKKWGIKGIYERLRWETEIETGGDGFKLNNNYTSRYARLLMEKNEELEGFFEIRERSGE
jgi:hypothetical protein